MTLRYSPTPEFDAWLAKNGPLDVAKYVDELGRADREGLTERLIDDYDQRNEESIWRQTKYYSEQPRRFRYFGAWPNRPALSFHLQTQILTQILRSDPECRAVIDFGALYAKPDADVARAFPHVTVYGVDRSELIKGMNIGAFPEIENLQFIASDILEFLRGHNDLRGGLLVHALTGICILPRMIEKLYAQCAVAGIKHIALVELSGYSHQLRQFFSYSETPQPSAVFRQGMILHDYPSMLRRAGYSVQDAQLIKCPMPKPMQQDAHLLTIHARLTGTPQES